MLRLLWLGPLVLLQACAGTPVAERLERSFTATQSAAPPSGRPSASSPPATASPAAPPPESPVAVVEPEEKASMKKDTEPTSTEISEDPTSPASVVSADQAEPYRITIRLSGADPSAPAEAVTRALRKADVRFAVERIERIQP